jgi:hypothetical protein
MSYMATLGLILRIIGFTIIAIFSYTILSNLNSDKPGSGMFTLFTMFIAPLIIITGLSLIWLGSKVSSGNSEVMSMPVDDNDKNFMSSDINADTIMLIIGSFVLLLFIVFILNFVLQGILG